MMYFLFFLINIFIFFVDNTDAADTATIAEKNARTMPLQGMFEGYDTVYCILTVIYFFSWRTNSS